MGLETSKTTSIAISVPASVKRQTYRGRDTWDITIGGTGSEFQCELKEPIKTPRYYVVTQSQIPRNLFEVTNTNNTLHLAILGTEKSVRISNGLYSIDKLVTTLNNALHKARAKVGEGFQVEISPTTYACTIRNIHDEPFSISLLGDNNIAPTLGLRRAAESKSIASVHTSTDREGVQCTQPEFVYLILNEARADLEEDTITYLTKVKVKTSASPGASPIEVPSQSLTNLTHERLTHISGKLRVMTRQGILESYDMSGVPWEFILRVITTTSKDKRESKLRSVAPDGDRSLKLISEVDLPGSVPTSGIERKSGLAHQDSSASDLISAPARLRRPTRQTDPRPRLKVGSRPPKSRADE